VLKTTSRRAEACAEKRSIALFISTTEIVATARTLAAADPRKGNVVEPAWRRLNGKEFALAKALVTPFLERPVSLRVLRTDCGAEAVRSARDIGMQVGAGADQSMRGLFGGASDVHPALAAGRRHGIARGLNLSIREPLSAALRDHFMPVTAEQRANYLELPPELEAALHLIRAKNIALLQEAHGPVFSPSSDELIPFHLTIVLRHALRLAIDGQGKETNRLVPILRSFEQGNFPLGATAKGTFITLTA
jgi:hypothetical protein